MSDNGGIDPVALDSYAQAIWNAMEGATVGVCISVGETGVERTVLVNDAAVSISGQPREVLLARPASAFLDPAEYPRLMERRRVRLPDQKASTLNETVLVHASGRKIPILYSVVPTFVGQTRGSVVIFWSIAERRAAEDALRTEEERLRHLVESAPDGIVVSRNGVVLDANPAAARMLGFAAGKDLVGVSLHHLMSPADTSAMIARVAALHGGGTFSPRLYTARRADGSYVTAEITSVPCNHDGAPAIMGFARDVTDRVKLESQLAQNERLTALGTLAAGVAHEINNPLTVLSLGVHALDLRLRRLLAGVDEAEVLQVRSLLSDLHVGVDRVSSIVRDLSAFSRVDDDEPAPIDLLAALAAAERVAAHQLRHRARVRTDYSVLPAAMGHAGRLEQVFVNLLLNAAQALPEGRAENRIDIRAFVAPDGRLAVEVEDNGPGMTEAVLSRAFEPFFTTKPIGEGTGLGLAVSHGIVKRMGGEIELTSTLGQGTRVRVLLAASARAPSRPVAAAVGASEPPVRTRILVVDDEPRLAATLHLLLGTEHDVTTVGGGEAACEVLVDRKESFDVILCDVMMPGVSGIDVYARVKDACPELLPRIVLMTGGACTARAASFLAAVPNPVLRKPFELAEVRRIIKGAIEA